MMKELKTPPLLQQNKKMTEIKEYESISVVAEIKRDAL
jgi:hypothetical protein